MIFNALVINDEVSGCIVDCEFGCLVFAPHTFPIGKTLEINISVIDELEEVRHD